MRRAKFTLDFLVLCSLFFAPAQWTPQKQVSRPHEDRYAQRQQILVLSSPKLSHLIREAFFMVVYIVCDIGIRHFLTPGVFHSGTRIHHHNFDGRTPVTFRVVVAKSHIVTYSQNSISYSNHSHGWRKQCAVGEDCRQEYTSPLGHRALVDSPCRQYALRGHPCGL